MTDTSKTPTTRNAAPKGAKAPQDRKPSAQQIARDKKKQEAEVQQYLSSGLDFSPFEVNVGDGVIWKFEPDISPRSAEKLRVAVIGLESIQSLDAKAQANINYEELFEPLISALREQLVDEKQRKMFPLPRYGIRALGWFASVVQVGKSGFPTSAD